MTVHIFDIGYLVYIIHSYNNYACIDFIIERFDIIITSPPTSGFSSSFLSYTVFLKLPFAAYVRKRPTFVLPSLPLSLIIPAVTLISSVLALVYGITLLFLLLEVSLQPNKATIYSIFPYAKPLMFPSKEVLFQDPEYYI